MSLQTTLLTSHKGVDLHAATAWRVMRDRLAGGERLTALHRCELHTFWDEPPGVSLDRLLETGRYYNPNKHHFAHFRGTGARWPANGGGPLPAGWPGEVGGSDLTVAPDALYAALLGGPVPAGHHAVDVAAWPREQDGAVLSGVLWRLVIRSEQAEAAEIGQRLAVARGRKEGLLLNPHMECWLTALR